MTFDVNYWAVLVAAISAMIIGGLWYSPLLFAKQWMAATGLSSEKLDELKRRGMAKSYLGALVGSLVTAYVLAILVQWGLASNWVEGLGVGFMAWLGFVATTTLSTILWEGKSAKLWFLNNAHELLVFLIMGAILAAW